MGGLRRPPLTAGRDESNNTLATLQPLVTPGFMKAEVSSIPNEDKRLGRCPGLELKPPGKPEQGRERTWHGHPWDQAPQRGCGHQEMRALFP